MTPEQHQKLKELHDRGYIVTISSRYVDTAVKSIYEKDGEIVFDSEVYRGAKLSYFDRSDVTVAKPVENWEAE